MLGLKLNHVCEGGTRGPFVDCFTVTTFIQENEEFKSHLTIYIFLFIRIPVTNVTIILSWQSLTSIFLLSNWDFG